MSIHKLHSPGTFENENTWDKAVKEGKEEEFHESYDKAVEKIRKQFGKTYPNVIGGKAVHSKAGTFEDVSPANIKEVLGIFQNGAKEDVDMAVEAAQKAFLKWGETPWRIRVRIFRKAADLVRKAKFEFAALVSFDNGKNRYEAMGDVDEVMDLLRYYSASMEVNKGYAIDMSRPGRRENVRSVLRPYGVWGVIAPFNFVALSAGMSTGALITGNTIVYKPATDTPWMGYRLLQYMTEAGLPGGVSNFVSGPGRVVGNGLIENQLVQGIVFTGSREVGVASYSRFTSKAPKPFIAEMGGKNATIVTSKADLTKAAEGVATAAFGYSGQKCSATSRVFVDNRVASEFEKLLVEAAKTRKVGNPTDRDAFVTPVINENAHKKFIHYAEMAMKDGKVLYGGRPVKTGDFSSGYFVEPTIVTDLPKDHPILKEELFVPIVAVASVNSLDEAIDEANKSEYGLTAGIFSNDRTEIQHFFKRIEAGVVYANRKSSATTGALMGYQPFVGWKYSGSSGKGAGGPYYLVQFLREQTQTTVR